MRDQIRSVWPIGLFFAAVTVVAVALRDTAPVGPSVQITAPVAGFKLRQGQAMSVRVSVQAGQRPLQAWTLRLLGPGGADTELATGNQPVTDRAVAQVVADGLSAGETYTLSLEAEDTGGVNTSADVSFLIPDPQYTLIPLEAGNMSLPFWFGLSMDSSGNIVAMGGNQFDDVQVVDAIDNAYTTIHLNLQGSGAFQLSGDGLRLVFGGTFGTTFAFGSLALDTQALTQGPLSNTTNWFSTDRTGRRLAFQSTFDLDPSVGNSGSTPQYFLYDFTTTEIQQLTNDPNAVNYSRPCDTTPLISADDAIVAFATTAALGLVGDDASVGCRIFAYNVATRSLRHVTDLGTDASLSGPGDISNDGRLLSLAVNRTVPPGFQLSLPALLDLTSGELVDPLGGITSFPSFDSVVSGDGSAVVISTLADLDPRVGNADHNMDLFVYDLATQTFTQVSETTGGLVESSGVCDSYDPPTSMDGSVVAFTFNVTSVPPCEFAMPQRNEADGFVFRRVRAVRKRLGNHPPQLQSVNAARVLGGGTLTLQFSATDPDGDPVVFFAQLAGGVDVPLGSTITDHHDGTATLSWPTKPEQVGSYPLRVAAFDAGGGETIQDLSLAVCSAIVSDGNLPGVLAALFESSDPGACHDAELNGDRVISAADVVKAARGGLNAPPAANGIGP
ncbi:MAG: hypothetical protein ACHQ4J_00260 [Candidatus Binatia bacterium]